MSGIPENEVDHTYPDWAGSAVIVVGIIGFLLICLFSPGGCKGGNGPSIIESMYLECEVCEDGKYHFSTGEYGPGYRCYHDPDKYTNP